MSKIQTELQKGRHCMVVHNSYPLVEPRVEREALALVRYGYEVDVIALTRPEEIPFEVVEGVNVYRLPIQRDKSLGFAGQFLEYFKFLTLAFFKLTALHWRRKYGTVEVHSPPDFLVFAALWPKLTGAKIILNIHDVMPEFFMSRSKRSMQSRLVKLILLEERISCWFADHVITVTELWRKTLSERSVPSHKTSVVMNAADSRIFSMDGRIRKTEAGKGSLRLIYHGTFAHRYGIDFAIRAVALVRKQIPDIRLTIHGRGEYFNELQDLVKELGVEKNVSFSTRFVPTDELPTIIQDSDLGIVPYRRDVFTDGILPTKLMEYTALGIPAVVARTPVIETYFNNDMVCYFNPEDVNDLARCILELSTDRQRLKELARNSEEFNRQYSWHAISKEYASLVDRLNAGKVA